MIRNFSLFNGGSKDFNHPQSKPKAALDGFPCGYWSPTYKDLYEVWNEVKRVLDPVTIGKGRAS